MFHEVVFQGSLVSGESVGLTLPGQASELVHAAVGELVEVALDTAAGDAGQAGDVLVSATLALEPQDFHLLLHARMRMVIAVVADRGQDFRSEGERTHGILLRS